MSKQWNLIVDVALCNNCHNCVLAEKDEHVDNDFPGYSAAQPRHGHEWFKVTRRVRGDAPMVDAAYLPSTCNNCARPPCIAAGDQAIEQRADGIVLIHPERAAGRQDLVNRCPYGAIVWNEKREIPQKWTFGAHLLDAGWSQPRCVQACPTGAIKAVKAADAEMAALAQSESLEVLHPEWNAAPRIYYKNLYRFTKEFIAGSVASLVLGRDECIAGVQVELFLGSNVVQRAVTDTYGDFKFDKLTAGASPYRVIVYDGTRRVEVGDIELVNSIYLGVIRLDNRSGEAAAPSSL